MQGGIALLPCSRIGDEGHVRNAKVEVVALGPLGSDEVRDIGDALEHGGGVGTPDERVVHLDGKQAGVETRSGYAFAVTRLSAHQTRDRRAVPVRILIFRLEVLQRLSASRIVGKVREQRARQVLVIEPASAVEHRDRHVGAARNAIPGVQDVRALHGSELAAIQVILLFLRSAGVVGNVDPRGKVARVPVHVIRLHGDNAGLVAQRFRRPLAAFYRPVWRRARSFLWFPASTMISGTTLRAQSSRRRIGQIGREAADAATSAHSTRMF